VVNTMTWTIRLLVTSFHAFYLSYLEDQYSREFLSEGLKVKLNILDTSGTETYVATNHTRVFRIKLVTNLFSGIRLQKGLFLSSVLDL
jgi:hypothetical protein